MSYLKFHFLKILFRTYNFFIIVHTFQWTSSEFFFTFRFSSKKSQSQQKLAKKITHVTIRFRSKSLTNFTENMFLCGIRKNICTAQFLDAQELHSWSILKANVCIFLHISVRKFLSHRHTSIYRHTSILSFIALKR